MSEFPSKDFRKQLRERLEWVKLERQEMREPAPKQAVIDSEMRAKYLQWALERVENGQHVPSQVQIELMQEGLLEKAGLLKGEGS